MSPASPRISTPPPSPARPPRSRWWPKPPMPKKQRRANRPSLEGKEKGPSGHCRAALFRSDLLGGERGANRRSDWGEGSERRNAGAEHRGERDKREDDWHDLVHSYFHRVVMTFSAKNARRRQSFRKMNSYIFATGRNYRLFRDSLPRHFLPNSFSISPCASFTQVGRPWLHWPECGVTSISRSSAFISGTDSTRPARTEP